MKRWFIAAIAMMVFSAGPVIAKDDHGSHSHDAGHAHGMEEGVSGTQTITGEVVDLACYLGEGLSGSGHRDCAEKCIASGLPVGIKTTDRLYLVIGAEHGPANKELASLAAKRVTAEGTVTERDGVHLFAVKKIAVDE